MDVEIVSSKMSTTLGYEEAMGDDMTIRRHRSAAEAITYIFCVNILTNEAIKSFASGANELRNVLNQYRNEAQREHIVK